MDKIRKLRDKQTETKREIVGDRERARERERERASERTVGHC